MAEHDIFMTVPRHDVQNADVTFEIRSNDNLLGVLGISRGTLAWTPKSRAHDTAFGLGAAHWAQRKVDQNAET